MDELDTAIQTILDQTGGTSLPQVKLTMTFDLKTDSGHTLLQRDFTQRLCLLDGNRLLKGADKALGDVIQAQYVRPVQLLFREVLERIRAAANLRQTPDPEFPVEQRRPAPTRADWNAPVSDPAYVPGDVMPWHGAHSRAIEGHPQLRP